ncbi:hypothetical protein ACFQET_04740 [Levilactobacillus tangyuanensis]|uniref:Uncharacterized protein n=1 Tax=Levilactobacillus tangyuanensis TaxID=2486021 RepID=A0ABW1TLW0_9LACO|nr:hypothetical protein [Levilactobacillus tangyuanensis]
MTKRLTTILLSTAIILNSLSLIITLHNRLTDHRTTNSPKKGFNNELTSWLNPFIFPIFH